jgi:hypothetical protein
MRKLIYLGWLIVLLPAMVFAQEKIEAPFWNVGDKWVFDREGPMEVTGRDAQCYAVQFSGGIFPKDESGIALFERSTLNVKYILERDQRKEYRGFRKKILNFPLTLGKQWKDLYQREEYGPTVSATSGTMAPVEYRETFRVLEWEEVEVRAGKFKAIKLEYQIEAFSRSRAVGWISQGESKALYWYSPEVKNFVKYQYEKGYQEALTKEKGAREDWELVSYELRP